MTLSVADWKMKNHKRLKRRSDLSERKSGQYNNGGRKERAVL